MTATAVGLSSKNFLLFFPPIKFHVEGGGKDLFTRWLLTNLLILVILVLTPPLIPLGVYYQQDEEAEEQESGREEEQQE